MTFQRLGILPAVFAMIGCGSPLESQSGESDIRFSDNPEEKPSSLSSQIPHETNPKNNPGYSGLRPETQRAFDVFSWQSFIALNWPSNPEGEPLTGTIGSQPDAPRVWESYDSLAEAFGRPAHSSERVAAAQERGALHLTRASKSPHLSEFEEALGGPLIDRNLNFVLYEVRLNDDEANYIKKNGLDTVAGQQAFMDAGNTVDFPSGYYDGERADRKGGQVGAIEIKLAWRILDPEKDADTRDRFYHTPAVITIPAKYSATGKPLVIDAEVGLVGMHVVHKTASESSWIWSTFEHVDNVPRSLADAETGSREYSFYDPATLFGISPNAKATKTTDEFLWAAAPPFAGEYAYKAVTGGGAGEFGTQATRVYPIYAETQRINGLWQKKLEGTVWANYQLIGSQWAATQDHPPFDLVSAPARLSNTTMETYVQSGGSCIECHKGATTTSGQPADFSFLLKSGPEAAAQD